VRRHIARLIAWLVAPLVADYSASRRLVVDYFASVARRVPRHVAWLVVDYFSYAARLGASALLTPKIGKVRSLTCGSNAVRNPSGRRKVSSEGFSKESAVGNSLPFGKKTVVLIFRDYVVTWPERKGRMDR
jgi:hypothetical protein